MMDGMLPKACMAIISTFLVIAISKKSTKEVGQHATHRSIISPSWDWVGGAFFDNFCFWGLKGIDFHTYISL
jgi:hypothetical protein